MHGLLFKRACRLTEVKFIHVQIIEYKLFEIARYNLNPDFEKL